MERRAGYRSIYHYELERIRESVPKPLLRDLLAAQHAHPHGFTFKFFPAADQAEDLDRALWSVRGAERAA